MDSFLEALRGFADAVPPWVGLVVGGICLIVVPLLLWRYDRAGSDVSIPPPVPVTIAVIEEQIDYPIGASFCVLMLVISSVVSMFAFAGSTTVLQETVYVLIWIGNTLLWGLGIAMARRRRYIVRKTDR